MIYKYVEKSEHVEIYDSKGWDIARFVKIDEKWMFQYCGEVFQQSIFTLEEMTELSEQLKDYNRLFAEQLDVCNKALAK